MKSTTATFLARARDGAGVNEAHRLKLWIVKLAIEQTYRSAATIVEHAIKTGIITREQLRALRGEADRLIPSQRPGNYKCSRARSFWPIERPRRTVIISVF